MRSDMIFGMVTGLLEIERHDRVTLRSRSALGADRYAHEREVRLILLGLQDRLMPIIDPTERERDRSVRRTSHGLPLLRSAMDAAPAGVPPCPQARQLAEHGRDRDWCAAQPTPGPAHRRQKVLIIRKIVPWVFSRCAPRALRSGATRKRGLSSLHAI